MRVKRLILRSGCLGKKINSQKKIKLKTFFLK